MQEDWRRLFTRWLPTVTLLVLLSAEVCSALLAHVPLRRNRFDNAAVLIGLSHVNARVVVLGDSTTGEATKGFNLGDRVVNLATDGNFGVMGDALLLKRYLAKNIAPEAVVLSFGPRVLTANEDVRIYRNSLWYVFRSPTERVELKAVYPEIDKRDSYPSAVNWYEKIVDPVRSLLFPSMAMANLSEQGAIPNGNSPVESTDRNLASPGTLKLIAEDPLKLTPAAIQALRDICQSAKGHHFGLMIATPPLPNLVLARWKADGRWKQYQERIQEEAGACGRTTALFDINEQIAFPAFDHIGRHVVGASWKERYAAVLRGSLRDAFLRP